MRKAMVGTMLTAVAATGLVLAGPASAAPKPGPGSVGPMHAPCNTAGPNLENRVEADAPASGAANQRSGSSTGCGAPGALQPTDDALYFCWTSGNDGFTWTYLRNQRTGVRGWVRDDLLDVNVDGFTRGSIRWCGF
ncbi:MAG TPA: SH3 domain-containing protein [Actinophytocola sp.]|uniref:SH3 domain-containing protein n=1 Tax=Actinophytocola sp. TaxID=1872138 RepID=UPI002DB92CBD|nr:SH3 domain-containing protein [Actinophytocola sp.]HEU5470933.1 SH3 domain-containing protein [Actinophytocola sp.]